LGLFSQNEIADSSVSDEEGQQHAENGGENHHNVGEQ
jgi:hypothetical protein